MRILIVACMCAVVYARAQNLETVPLEAPIEENIDGDTSQVNDGETNIDVDNFDEGSTPNPYGYVTKADGVISGERKGRYQALPDQYNEESAPVSVGRTTCKEKNERYSIPGSCDRYIECLNGTAEEKQCPDGLRYNPNVRFNVYPCQYPIDVPCLGRSALQPAQPTNDCPHQFGYFKTGDARNCSGFRNCVNGVGYDFTCPEGLAFSSENYRCEWPDEVEDCDAEAFLGFRCPEIPVSKELGPPAGFRTYRSPSDCQIYFICINNKPRRLSCGGYSAYDELTESCVAADEISACPQELRTNAAKSREAEKQRLTAVEAFQKLRYDPKELFNSPSTVQPEQFDDVENETQSPEQY